MILITGGRGQGKLDFARSLAAFEIGGSQIADGETDPFEAAFSRPVIKHFERYIKRGMQNQLDCEAFLRRILSDNPDAIVIADEIGCGIVPVDAFEAGVPRRGRAAVPASGAGGRRRLPRDLRHRTAD